MVEAVVNSVLCQIRREIPNVIVTILELEEICLEKERVESKMKPRFLAEEFRKVRMCRGQRNRRINYLRRLLRNINENKVSF